MSQAENQTSASEVGGEHSSKELFEKSTYRFSEHLQMSLRQYSTF
jgi:hypothetical protein